MCAYEPKDYVGIVNFFIKRTNISCNVYTIKTSVLTCQQMEMKLRIVRVAQPQPLPFFKLLTSLWAQLRELFPKFFGVFNFYGLAHKGCCLKSPQLHQ